MIDSNGKNKQKKKQKTKKLVIKLGIGGPQKSVGLLTALKKTALKKNHELLTSLIHKLLLQCGTSRRRY